MDISVFGGKPIAGKIHPTVVALLNSFINFSQRLYLDQITLMR